MRNQQLNPIAAPQAAGILAEAAQNSGNRWWVYQRERFPLLLHGPVIAVFGIAAICFSRLLRGSAGWPTMRSVVVACATSLLFFFQLRIADEWKDYADDLRFRPYRPVPRGLVTLVELRRLWIASAAVQVGFALWLEPALLGLLLATWAYMGLMAKEFGIGGWLRRHPVAYLLSHMLIMPLIYLYATACDWLPAADVHWLALSWFLVCGFFLGLVFEFGRKIRAPYDEEAGVDTYSALWGRHRAVAAWMGAVVSSFGAALLAMQPVGMRATPMFVLATFVAVASAVCGVFLRHPESANARRIEQMSGVWTLALLLGMGPVPLLFAR